MDFNAVLTGGMLLSLSGATAVTFLIVNVIRSQTGFNKPWLGLAVALIVQFLVWTAFTDRSFQQLVISLATAFVVVYGLSYFSTSLLWKTIVSQKDKDRLALDAKPRFFEPWW